MIPPASTSEPAPLKRPDPQAIYARLWTTVYAPRYREQVALDAQRRAEAFVSGPRLIGGWLLRVMTPYDALLFEGYESPFIGDTPESATPEQLGWALWHLRADTTAKWFPSIARDRQILRWRRAWLNRDGTTTPAYLAQLTAFLAYMEDLFAESSLPSTVEQPKPGEKARKRPAYGTHWLAPLLTSLACEMGPRDPINDLPWAHVPLPQVWQYRRELHARATREPVRDGGPAAALEAECLAAADAEFKAQLRAYTEATRPVAPISPLPAHST